MEKCGEGCYQDQHGGKVDSRTTKKKSAVVSPKVGAATGTNREKQVDLGDRSGRSQQSNLTHKLSPVPVMKRKLQKTAGAGPKIRSVYSLRSRDEKPKAAKDPRAYNLRSKIQKTEEQNAYTVIQNRNPPKKYGSKDSSVAIEKRETPKIRPPGSFAPPNKNIGTTNPLTILSSGHHDTKNQPSSSQYEPCFDQPFYHIKWEGDDMGNRPFGQNCVICNKDLSRATDDDDLGVDEDFEYEEHDGYVYEYYDDDDALPHLLPAVDILPCGHAYHTECLQQHTTKEQLSDPQCVLCSSRIP